LVCLAPGPTGPQARIEQRESLELAFVAALQHLPPRQRCVLVLRDVLSFSAQEVAEMLATSPTSVHSALQRAREAVAARLPGGSQQASLRALGDSRLRDVVSRLIGAFERGDVEAILAMLAEDATFSMPPYAEWYQGREAIRDSWLMPQDQPTGLRFVTTWASGQPAFGVYKQASAGEPHVLVALEVLSFRGELIDEVVCFRDLAVVRRFGLPAELPARP
jgi:RNA polymerase sigma-70 factor, ECF subfamily